MVDIGIGIWGGTKGRHHETYRHHEIDPEIERQEIKTWGGGAGLGSEGLFLFFCSKVFKAM